MQPFSLGLRQLNLRVFPLVRHFKPLLVVRTCAVPIASSFSQNTSGGKSSKYLRVILPGTTHSLDIHPFWLRDHCRCPSCYNSITYQRNIDILSIINDDLIIKEYSTTGDRLHITWSDGHQSSYSLTWLKDNIYEGRRKQQSDNRGRILWNSSIINQVNLEPIFQSQLNSNEVMREVYNRLFRYGFVKIEQVPPNRESTMDVAHKIFRRTSNTVFGNGLWEIGNNFDHRDTGYTTASLELHTDNTYFTEAAGNLVFHCIEYNGTGGESIYVDGFYVGQKLKERDPEAYHFLSRTTIESEYIEPGHHFVGKGPCFLQHPVSGEVEQIRFNLLDRAPLDTIPQTQVEQYYRHLRTLTSIIKDKKNEYVTRLSPGTVLIIDNFRLLHARNAYQGTRVVAGCYVSRSDFVSRSKIFGIELSA